MARRIPPIPTIVSLLLVVASLHANAQQDPLYAQYWMVETQYNPAAAGKSDQLNITAALQTHAAGFQQAGQTLFAGADVAFMLGKTRHGAGALFQADNIGIFSHKKFAVQYAYQFRMGQKKDHHLSLGLQADLLQESADGSKADLEDPSDPAFSSSQMTGSGFDLSVGLLYQWKDLSVGLALSHALAPTVDLGDKNQYQTKRHYYMNAAYTVHTDNPYFKMVPSAILRTDLLSWRGDLTARFIFERDTKNFNFGASYAPKHSFTIFAGCVFHGINICYSYEANTQGMGLGAGQHEVSLGYKLDLNLGKKGRNLHKSVRWL